MAYIDAMLCVYTVLLFVVRVMERGAVSLSGTYKSSIMPEQGDEHIREGRKPLLRCSWLASVASLCLFFVYSGATGTIVHFSYS